MLSQFIEPIDYTVTQGTDLGRLMTNVPGTNKISFVNAANGTQGWDPLVNVNPRRVKRLRLPFLSPENIAVDY